MLLNQSNSAPQGYWQCLETNWGGEYSWDLVDGPKAAAQ